MNKSKITLNSTSKQNIVIIIAFIVLIAIFSFGSEYFFTMNNISAMLIAAVPLGLIAIGECTCLMSGNFDMSAGMVASLSGVIWGSLVAQSGVNTWLAFSLALLFGLGSGCIAGFCVSWLKLPAWMVTYSLMQIWRGVIMVITEGKAISLSQYSDFKILGQTKVWGALTLPVLFLAIAYLLMVFMLKYTRLGRALYTIGGNVEAARNVGIRVERNTFFSFALSGTMAALAGLLFASRSATAQPIIGELYVMQAIAAAVVGGTKMSGGKANMGMTFIGVMIIIIIQNGLSMIQVPAFYQYIATGVILFLAIMSQTQRSK